MGGPHGSSSRAAGAWELHGSYSLGSHPHPSRAGTRVLLPNHPVAAEIHLSVAITHCLALGEMERGPWVLFPLMSPGKSCPGVGMESGMESEEGCGLEVSCRMLKCGNIVKRSVMKSLSLRADPGAWELSPGHG